MIPTANPQLRKMLEDGVRAGGLVSDGPVPADFTAGWALHPFKGRAAHYWRQSPVKRDKENRPYQLVQSECGMRSVTTQQVGLVGPGNYPYCQRCDSKLLRKAGL